MVREESLGKMVKAKKKNLSEFVEQRRAQRDKKQLNPFEVHINRNKRKVLGQQNKNDHGLPGVSRAKAINRRKQTLLQEYKQRNKDNVFLDRRIGARDATMSAEDKAMARFAMEHMKVHKKKNIYSLNDDEVLTHKGQTLEEIEKFDDPKSDDEFSDGENNNSGKLDKDFVEEAHFGGGVLSRSNSVESSRKSLIEQLITESKKRKVEKQKIREQTIDLTEKLDSEWRDLLPLVSASTKSEEVGEITKADAYDTAVRELKFEARGNPTEKLRSEEEIVQEEKEKLEKLEADRLARMKGFVSETSNERKHRSADDLDDSFMIETITEEANNDDDNSTVDDSDDDSNKEESDDDDSNKEESDDDDTKININGISNIYNDKCERTKLDIGIVERKTRKTNTEDKKNKEKTLAEISNVKDELDMDSNNEDSEYEYPNDDKDNLSDLKGSESSSEDENEVVKRHVTFSDNSTKDTRQTDHSDQVCPKSILKQSHSDAQDTTESRDKQQEIRYDLLKRKDIMEKARKELPYIYKAPESFEELEKLLESHGSERQSIIVERIIKCNHWTLDGKNREKLSNLFVYLLQHINNCAFTNDFDDLIKCFQIFDRLCPYLYDLAHMNADHAKSCVQEVIKEKHDKFERNKKKYPGMDTLIFFKLVSLLFPTSDFRHPVVTPCLIFMSQILLRGRIKNRQDIAKGLFVCTLILEYTLLSKRFAPSAINFLRGVIYAATPEVGSLIPRIKVIPPFKTTCKFLVINEKSDVEIDPNVAQMTTSDLIHEELDDVFRIKALVTAVNLIREFKDQLQELETAYSIFEPIFKLLSINKFKKCPQNVRTRIKELRKELEALRDKKLEYLVAKEKRPKPLRMYKPKIMTVYDDKRRKPISKKRAEREKLLHKYKKEMKGAIREIRRDSAFLAKVQISQQIKNDAERKRKVKEIFGDAAIQQSELKRIKKKI